MNYFDEELIVAYLDQSLSKAEMNDFEQELAKNPNLNREVELFQKAIKSVELGGRKRLSQKISQISDNNLNQGATNETKAKEIKMNTQRKNNTSLWIGIAAGLALLLVGINFMNTEGGEDFDPVKIYTDNYSPKSSETAKVLGNLAQQNIKSRGEGEEDEKIVLYKGKEISQAEFAEIERLRRDTLIQGLKLFEKGKWAESKTFLSSYINSFPEPVEDFSTALYYMGKVQMNDELYKLALGHFNSFIDIPQSDKVLRTNAEWERALCALRVDERKAKDWFDEIAKNNNHQFQDEAKGILAYFE